jgi:hypothetical protein
MPALLAIAAAEWATIGSAAVGLAALGLSIFSIWHQRRQPFLEAQTIHDVGTLTTAVAVQNNGNRSAKAPWVMFATKDGNLSFCSHVSAGFLGVGVGRYVLTNAPGPHGPVVGVVGFVDSRGRHIVRRMSGGRKKVFKGGSFESMFRAFYPEVELGHQVSKASDAPLA